MPETDDIALLREYAESDSEAAFSALVGRHVNLVHSVAWRCVGSAHAAEEITQAVFIILARKAKSLNEKTVLSGWLHQTARLTAANYLRQEIRRQKREQEAYMQSLLDEPGSEVWRQIAPLLDDAMGRLGEKDRNAIVLRFFENRNLREVGVVLGTNEDAAKMRVRRALEKLRKFFTKRGVVLTTAIIGRAVSTNSVHAAPEGLAKTVSAIAAAKGAVASTSISTLAKGALKTMAWTKAKTGIMAGVAVIIAAAVATPPVEHILNRRRAVEIAREAVNAYAALSSYSDNGKVVTQGAGPVITTTFSTRLQRPNLYRIDWTQTGGLYGSKGSVWSDGSGNYFTMGTAGREQNATPEKMKTMQMALGSATGASDSAAATVPAAFFNQGWGDALALAATARMKAHCEKDQTIGGVNCSVITYSLDSTHLPSRRGKGNTVPKLGLTATTLWIGKQDHLIYQVRTRLERPHYPRSAMDAVITDSNLKTLLARQNKAATPQAIAALRKQLEAQMNQAQGKPVVFTQTHENISVNQTFSASDFLPPGN